MPAAASQMSDVRCPMSDKCADRRSLDFVWEKFSNETELGVAGLMVATTSLKLLTIFTCICVCVYNFQHYLRIQCARACVGM
jgi:hypothetical protein